MNNQTTSCNIHKKMESLLDNDEFIINLNLCNEENHLKKVIIDCR